MKRNNGRNIWIDAMRITFCIWIILMHGEYLYHGTSAKRMFEGGYLGCEFFFIVSGYYLLQNKQSSNSLKKFCLNRLKKLYPHFVLSILICAAVGLPQTLANICLNLIGFQLVFVSRYINGVLWFIVAEIPVCIVLLLLYKLAKNNRITVNLYYIGITTIMLYIVYTVYSKYTSFDYVNLKFGDFAYPPFFRALYAVIYGIVINHIFSCERIKSIVTKFAIQSKMLIFSLTFLTLYLQFVYPHTRIELLCVVILGVITGISGNINWRYRTVPLSKYTHCIYIYQMIVITEFDKILGQKFSIFYGALLITSAFAFGIVMYYIWKFIRDIIQKDGLNEHKSDISSGFRASN